MGMPIFIPLYVNDARNPQALAGFLLYSGSGVQYVLKQKRRSIEWRFWFCTSG